MALGMFSVTILVAPVVGPVLGGWITDNFSWPWIFFINIPVGLISLAMTWTLYRNRETPRVNTAIVSLGVVLRVVWVGALWLVLVMGTGLGWFESPEIIALEIAAALAFCLFLSWELTDKRPVVDLSLFRNRNFSTGTIAISIAYAAYFGSIVLLPLWLQQFMGYTATDAGLVLAPVGVLAIILTPLVGRFGNRIDTRLLATTSLVIFAIVAWMRSGFTSEVDIMTLVWPTVLQGAAVSCLFIPLAALALGGLRSDQIAAASGLNNFLRITAGGFATSIATTLWEGRAALHHARIVERITPSDPAVNATLQSLSALGMSPEQQYGFLNQLVNRQAFTLSALDLFYGSAPLPVAPIPVLWISRPPRRRRRASADGAHRHGLT